MLFCYIFAVSRRAQRSGAERSRARSGTPQDKSGLRPLLNLWWIFLFTASLSFFLSVRALSLALILHRSVSSAGERQLSCASASYSCVCSRHSHSLTVR